jgi:hypothetical protein
MQRYGTFFGFITVLVLCLVSFAQAIPAFASQYPNRCVSEDDIVMAQQAIIELSARYNAINDKLHSSDRATWTVTDIDEYLNTSLWVVYEGLSCYWMENAKLPSSIEELSGGEFIPEWPENPYNDWKPVAIKQASDGFSAGDLVWQICPPEFYSGLKNPRAMSCVLSIYGPDIEFARFGDAAVGKNNTWALLPVGTLYMYDIFTEPASSAREKFRKIESK